MNKMKILNLWVGFCFAVFMAVVLSSCLSGERKEFSQGPSVIKKREVKTLPLGAKTPDFYLPGANGRFYRLSDFDRSRLFLVIFTCNHCPESQMYEDVIKDIEDNYKRKQLQIVCISPNSPLAVLYEDLRYSDLNDDYESMKVRAEVKEFNFPYLYDGDNQAVSLKYGPTHTPHAFLFDRHRRLRYRGRLDEVLVPDKVNGGLLRNAIDALLKDEDVKVAETESEGCDIKWSWNYKLKEKEEKMWKNRPVMLDNIDLESIKILMSNPTRKLLLLNFWASWCAPCVEEMPAFVEAYRMYYSNLEMVTISTDKLEDKEKVREVLKQHHASMSNYIYKGSHSELIKSVKPFWNGSVPMTILIEPGGEVANMWYGVIYPFALRRAIVENRFMGRFRKIDN